MRQPQLFQLIVENTPTTPVMEVRRCCYCGARTLLKINRQDLMECCNPGDCFEREGNLGSGGIGR